MAPVPREQRYTFADLLTWNDGICLPNPRKNRGVEMKRGFCAVLLLLILTGCGSSASLKPGQIQYQDKILTYGTSDIDDVFWDDGIDLKINSANEIRSITISTADVITYNDISVGDKLSKVESKYQYETTIANTISVVLHGTQELDPNSQDKPKDSIWINYKNDGTTVTSITIYDVTYGLTMK